LCLHKILGSLFKFENSLFTRHFRSIKIAIITIRRKRPIIVTSKIVPISIVVKIIISNEVYINMLFLGNQRGQRNIIRINMSPIIRKHKHNSINLITQGKGFLNRIYLLTLWSSLSVWYVSNVSIIFDAPCLFLHHLLSVSLHFVAFLCIFWN
jgi:hypothetical protein